MTTIHEIDRGDRRRLDATHEYLMLHEATHCLQIGLLIPFAQGMTDNSRWWVAEEGGSIVGIASRTDPHNVIVSVMANDSVASEFASTLAEVYPELPGVIGPKLSAHQIATAWAALRAIEFRVETNEAVYECSHVDFPEQMSGSARFANELDIPWMIPWIDQFHVDVGLQEVRAEHQTEENVRHRLERGGYVLWLDERGEVVSLAGYANPTPNGIRVGPVYTVEHQRNRGYGAAVSAAVTQHLLDSGRSVVFLFTDLDYPVSNHVYKKIGYKAVAEFTVYAFSSSI